MARELDALVARRGVPATIVSDNGAELTSRAVLDWGNRTGVAWHYIAPGKPAQNAFVESFNGRFRDELLNEEIFDDLARPLPARALAAGLQPSPAAFRSRGSVAGRRLAARRGRPAGLLDCPAERPHAPSPSPSYQPTGLPS